MHPVRRRILTPLTLLLALLLAGAALAQDADTRELTLLHDTHFHGTFGDADGASIARYAALVQELRGDGENALFLGNGDDLAPSLLASVHQGAHMVEALNMMGLDYDTLGNHEFDYGADNLLEQVRASDFGWVSANIVDGRTGDVFGAEAGVRRYAIHEAANGLRIGITGFAPPDTPEVTSLGEHAEMVDLEQAAREVVSALQGEDVDLIVGLSHLCTTQAEDLAATVDGFDVLVGDHCSAVLEEPVEVNDTIVSRVGDEFDYLGELTLQVGRDGVDAYDFTLHEVTAELEPHAEIAARTHALERELDEALSEVVGETTVPLDARRDAVRGEETNIGNFIADVMRERTDADIALQNGGSIRADQIYEPGDLTLRNVVETLPFENYVVVIEVDGATVREALELSVSTVEEGHGRFLQVSGLTFAFDPDAPVGERVQDVTVGGEPLDPGASYELATNSFMAEGGDGYEMLVGTPYLLDENDGELHSAMIEAAIRQRSPIAPETEGRIRTID